MSPFDVKRAALMTASAVFAWMGSAAVATDHGRGGSQAAPVPRTKHEAPPAPVTIEPLHDWRRLIAAPAQARNLFAFRAGDSHSAIVQKKTEDAAPPAVAPALPPPPAMKLEGIAEDFGTSGATRTAIISAAGQLLLVTDGGGLYRIK
jgi:hypothetical protein